MKKIFLIPLLTLLSCVMAWGGNVEIAQIGATTYYQGDEADAENHIYETAQLALNATIADVANEGTIKLLNSVTGQITLGSGLNKTITFDLNGKTLTCTTGININGGSKLILVNTDTQNEGCINNTSTSTAYVSAIRVQANAELEINDGVIVQTSGKLYTVYGYANSTITINGGTIKHIGTTAKDVVYCNGATLTMNDGTIESTTKWDALYAQSGAQITMNGGLITNTCTGAAGYAIDLYGNTSGSGDPIATTLTINGGSIVSNTAQKGYGISVYGNGTTLNMTGGSINAKSFAITGNGTAKYAGTTTNITGGNIHGGAAAIYHPQAGTLNITDGTFTSDRESTIEMRAGTLTIDGGSFTANATEFVNEANGSGSTTTGAAIAIAQHTTKLPINVTINGGEFRAIYPIAQANPQKNETAYVNQVDITVNDGKFWATNTANVAAYTQDNKLSLKGGYYNLAPHAFVADGYMAISNPDAAPAPTAAEGYLFKVGEYVEESKTTITDGNWVVETTWESTEVPTEVTAVTIPADGEVFIQPTGTDEEVVAYASSLDLEAGATLTIKDGATLVLGKDADVDASANLVVEEGGQLLIAPTATPVQPVGSVTLVADGAGLKEGKSDYTNPANLYWQHFAIPTVGAPTSIALSYPNGTPITEAITYYNSWDIVNGWESIVKTDLTEPFVGYNFSNIKDYGTNVNYTFTGQLVGNASSPLNFTRRGFNFFGNSYLAPINIRALQAAMYEQGLEFTVYIFTKQGKKQTYRAINEVTASIYGIEEIKPLQGFFMFAEKATEADFQYNSAVYSAFINKQNGGSNNAPARRAASQYDAKAIIGIESAEGEYDEVVLVASNDFSDEYDLKADARKLENAGMNIYADGSFDYLAVMATDDLMGQTLSFKAGNEAQYTMTFSGIEGELALRDNATGNVIAIEEGATYEFAAQPNSTIEGRFEIVGRNNAPTAIDNTEVKANVKGIYTITGQYVGEDFKALPAGVYVVNGVKIVK
ncbi:MAG: hypothetical protein J5937_04125 [Paludibacteraceae bacterium]|nr:hypothetical protein [Paludibacteraceae bacterium]